MNPPPRWLFSATCQQAGIGRSRSTLETLEDDLRRITRQLSARPVAATLKAEAGTLAWIAEQFPKREPATPTIANFCGVRLVESAIVPPGFAVAFDQRGEVLEILDLRPAEPATPR